MQCGSLFLKHIFESLSYSLLIYRLDYEFVARGTMYRRGRMRITVSSIFKMQNPGDTSNIDPVNMSHLVELSVMAAKTVSLPLH